MRGQYFANGTVGLSILPICLGINAILRPASALAIFNFPEPPQPEGRKLARSLMQLYGARNLSMGLATVAVWSAGADPRSLGWMVLANVPVALMDGLVSRWQIGGGEWGHWFFVLVSFGLAGGLLGYI
jgi:hypothetical protein